VKRLSFLGAALALVLLACKTPSFGDRDEAVFPVTLETAEAEIAEEPEPAPFSVEEPVAFEPPSVGDLPEEPSEELVIEVPPPEEPEFPAVSAFLEPPDEALTALGYPEPEPPDLPSIPEPAPPPPIPGPVQAPAFAEPVMPAVPVPELAAVPEEAPSPEPEPSPEPSPPPPPPSPPPFIRPAETALARPAPREPLPVPVNPVPEVPAVRPPVRPAPPPSAQTPSNLIDPAITALPTSSGNEDEVTYSRTIRGTAGQILEVPFRGTGWVYLGEADAKQGITYLSRRTDPEGQSFIFRLDGRGEYELKFYKQDFIRDYILNDHVRVIVEDAPERNSFFYPEDPDKVVAEPRWPLPETAAGQAAALLPALHAGQPGETTAAGPGTGQPTAGQGGRQPEAAMAASPGRGQPGAMAGQGSGQPGVAEAAFPFDRQLETAEAAAEPAASGEGAPQSEALMTQAWEAYGAGHFPEALAALEEFRASFPLGSDEAWWLYGQLFEAPGPQRDVRGALEYYRRLVREYPQSSRGADAEKRIAHLERFYFNIR
jgi:hypothetical protein